MNRYWSRIALGALLVFGVGLAGLAVVRKGTAQVRNLLGTAAARLPLRFANLGFRLDGRRLGELTGLEIVRNGPAEVGHLTGHVELTESGAAEALQDCVLTLEDADNLSENSSFSCASAAELGSGNLVEVGELVFQPGSLTRPLYLPDRMVAEWRRSEVQQLDASLARDGAGGVRANGRFDLLDRRQGSQRGSFDLRADSDGAMLSVRDEQNRAIVDFRATQNGIKLNIRDRRGRHLLRLLADSLGASLTTSK